MRFKLLVYPPLLVLFWTVCTLAAKMHPPVEPPPGIYYDKFLWVKFEDDLDIGLSPEGIPIDRSGGGISGPQGQAVMEYIREQGGRWERMSAVSEARADEWRMKAAFNGKTTADLNTYFHLWVGEEASAQDWLERLTELPQVDKLGRVPKPSLPTPPKYDSLQRYMNVVYPVDTAYSTHKSIEANYAWQFLGGHGQNVTICDTEMDWNFDHADLPDCIEVWVPNGYCWSHDSDPGANGHGTADLGILGSRRNEFGTTGIVTGSRLAVAPVYIGTTGNCGYYFMPGTVLSAVMDRMDEGDIIMIELQTAVGIDSLSNLAHYGPLETYLPVHDLIETATSNGIHVVAAAGNGGHDLADIDVDSIFVDTANWSGAIIVGAGTPGPSVFDTLDRPPLVFNLYYDSLPARSAGPFFSISPWRSCYGPLDTGNFVRRVDVQAWGDLIVAPGYGNYYSQEGGNHYYTRWHNGTSSATPIVTGAVAQLEGIYEEVYGVPMPTQVMRGLLRSTGLPQQGSDSLTYPIGPLVNVRLAIVSAFGSLTPCCIGKRGNVNGDTLGTVDLSDLSVLIGYLDDTCHAELPCPSAADVNGDGMIDGSDVTVLVQYLVFRIDNRANCSLGRGVVIPGWKGGRYEVDAVYYAGLGRSESRGSYNSSSC